LAYTGQIGRDLKTRGDEYCRYMKTNNRLSAYVHVLGNKHENGFVHTMAKLIKSWEKSKILNCWENFCIQSYHQQGQLVPIQPVYD
jgi:hypothetical protein